jgi:coenzyme F420-reducing hydrogenase delta subunit
VRPLVLACERANLAAHRELGGRARVLQLPCAGRVSLPLLLWGVARGAAGVLVLGRQQHTCRFDGAEDPAADRVARASRLLALAGLDRRRVQFVVPEPGPNGAARAVERFVSEVQALGEPALEPAPAQVPAANGEGLDTCLALLSWLAQQPALEPGGEAWLREARLPEAEAGGAALSAGPLPWLQLLGGSLLRPLNLTAALEAGLAVLGLLAPGPAGVRVGRGVAGWDLDAHRLLQQGGDGLLYCLCPEEREGLGRAGVEALALDDLLRQRGGELPPPMPGTVACDGSPEQVSLVEALGHRALSVGPDPLPDGFSLTPQLRAAADERLARVEAGGARALLAPSPLALARWALICRQGSWRQSRVWPVLGVQLAARPATAHGAVS